MIRELKRHRTGERDDAGFGHPIGREVQRPHQARHRRHRDNAAVLAPRHLARRGLRTIERARQMHPQMAFPILAADFQEGFALRHAGVVDQDVDPAQFARRVGDPSLRLDTVADIDLTKRGPAAKRDDFLRGRARGVSIDFGQRDVRALASEGERDGLADSRPAPVISATWSLNRIETPPSD